MDNLLLSLIVTLFWSSILILMLIIGRKRKLFREQWGITGIVTMEIVCMLRLLLPYDFGLQRRIFCPGIFSDVYEFFILDTHTVGKWEFSIWNILLAVWLAVAVSLLMYYVFHYLRFAGNIRRNCQTDERLEKMLYRVQEQAGKRKSGILVCRGNMVSVPLSMGVFHPVILLPEKEYPEEELLHILAHEYTHIRYHDSTWKWISQIVCCIFWWNSFACFLQQALAETLENRCDLTVTQNMTQTEAASYLRTILRTLKDAKGDCEKIPLSTLAGKAKGKAAGRAVEERFRLVAERYPLNGTNKKGKILFYAVLAAMVIASYSMVWMPSYQPTVEDFEGGYEANPETDYIEIGEDGSYYIVYIFGRDKISEEAVEIFLECGLEIR